MAFTQLPDQILDHRGGAAVAIVSGLCYTMSCKHIMEDVMPILKLEDDNENQQLEFELAFQRTLTTQERFELMFRKSREIAEVLLRHGYRKPVEIVKRT
jgi:hypothetical protein